MSASIYASIAMTVLVILFCEMLPKTAAINTPDRYALAVARSMRRVVRVLGPVLDGARLAGTPMLAAAGVKVGEGEPLLPGHERLRGAVDLLHREGSVEKHDRDMLGGLLDLRDLTVADVMIHRTEVITADVAEPPEKIVEAVLKEPVTRVPLWRGTPENIVGILHVKDLLRAIQAAGGDPTRSTSWRSRGRPGSCRKSARSPSSSRHFAAAARRSRSSSTNMASSWAS